MSPNRRNLDQIEVTDEELDNPTHLQKIAAELRPLLNRLILLYYRQYSQSELSSAQISILTVLSNTGPMRVSDIARRELIRMPTASNAVHQLEVEGMVQRQRDPDDRRGVKVGLTLKGTLALADVNNKRNKAFAEFLGTLDESAQDMAVALIPVLQQLIETMENESGRTR